MTKYYNEYGYVFLLFYLWSAISHWMLAVSVWRKKRRSGTYVPFVGGLAGCLGVLMTPELPKWLAVVLPFLDVGFVVCLMGLPLLVGELCRSALKAFKRWVGKREMGK